MRGKWRTLAAGCLGLHLFVSAATAQGPVEQALARTDASPRAGASAAATPVPVPAADQEAMRQAILTMAQDGFSRIQAEIRDYTCVLVKRERVNGKLGAYQFMSAKVRHDRDSAPFSVYLKFLAPDDLKGREVLFVEGHNDNKLIARKGGSRFAYITTEVEPTSDLAMEDNRYPITEFGIENLVKRLLDHLDHAVLDDCSIQMLEGAKVDGRSCLSIQITNKVRPSADATLTSTGDAKGEPAANGGSDNNAARHTARFHIARVYIDDELQLPIHYEAFDWPRTEGEEPRLLEQYTYRQLKLNVGLTDQDFQRNNPAYGFRKQ